jgi:hypothetical protein
MSPTSCQTAPPRARDAFNCASTKTAIIAACFWRSQTCFEKYFSHGPNLVFRHAPYRLPVDVRRYFSCRKETFLQHIWTTTCAVHFGKARWRFDAKQDAGNWGNKAGGCGILAPQPPANQAGNGSAPALCFMPGYPHCPATNAIFI